MLEPTTAPRMQKRSPVERAARHLLVVLLVEALISFVLVAQTRTWQTVILFVILAALITLDAILISRARRWQLSRWQPWLILSVAWASFVLFSVLTTGAGIPLAVTAALFSISLAAILFERTRSTLPMLAGVSVALLILFIEFGLQPPFRQPLPPAFSNFLPVLVVALTVLLVLLIVQQFSLLSLRQKLVISFILLSLIPVAGIRYLYDTAFRTALTASASQNLSAVAAQTAGEIDTFIDSNLDSVTIQARLPAFRRLLETPQDDPAYPAALSNATELIYSLQELEAGPDDSESDSYLISHSLINREGVVILDTSTAPGRFNPELGRDYSDDPIFLNPALIGLPYASPLRVESDMRSARIIFATRITNENNQPVGVFVIAYDARFLQDLLIENRDLAGRGSYGILFDENNIYLAHPVQPELVFRSVAPLDPRVYTELVNAGRLPEEPTALQSVGFYELDNALDNAARQPTFGLVDQTQGDTTTQVATARLSTYPWQVAFFQPEAVFLAPLNRQTVNSLILTAVIAAAAFLTALYASEQLARPILQLTEAAEEVSAGRLNVEAQVQVQDEVGTLASAFNSMTRQLRETLIQLEQLVAVRTERLEATIEVGRVATSILDPDDLIANIVNLISERFGYYYAAIFLVDADGKWAVLKEATGSAGAQLKAEGHRLEVGGKNMVGQAIRTFTARIAQDVSQETQRFANPLLPETRSEIALPLLVGDHVIGVLDVQSKDRQAFDRQVIDTLQTLASQVAIAIENANLFRSAQQAAESQQRLNELAANIQRAPDVNQILNTTIRELAGILETDEISIRLLPPDDRPRSTNGTPSEKTAAEKDG